MHRLWYFGWWFKQARGVCVRHIKAENSLFKLSIFRCDVGILLLYGQIPTTSKPCNERGATAGAGCGDIPQKSDVITVVLPNWAGIRLKTPLDTFFFMSSCSLRVWEFSVFHSPFPPPLFLRGALFLLLLLFFLTGLAAALVVAFFFLFFFWLSFLSFPFLPFPCSFFFFLRYGRFFSFPVKTNTFLFLSLKCFSSPLPYISSPPASDLVCLRWLRLYLYGLHHPL